MRRTSQDHGGLEAARRHAAGASEGFEAPKADAPEPDVPANRSKTRLSRPLSRRASAFGSVR